MITVDVLQRTLINYSFTVIPIKFYNKRLSEICGFTYFLVGSPKIFI